MITPVKTFPDFHKTEMNFFSIISDSQIDYGNFIAYTTGVQAPSLNPAIVHKTDEGFSQQLNDCRIFYKNKNLPWALILPEYLNSKPIEEIMEEHQLILNDQGIAMSMEVQTQQIPSTKSLLKIKSMDHDLAVWSIPLINGFESTPEITSVYTKRHQLALKQRSGIYHFSGFINDTPICSLTVSIYSDLARIDDVATMPAHQNKGYATELIYTALKTLQQIKIKTCYLEASTSGFTLYKRIGFNELFKKHYYELRQHQIHES